MLVPFLGWVLLPYWLLRRMLHPTAPSAPGRAATRLLHLLAWLLVIGTPILYAQTMFVRTSSTGGLVFLFLPLYQLLLIGGVRLLSQWIGRTHTPS